MWTRADLKARAKDVLRGNYGKAFLISLVIMCVTGGGGNGGGSASSGGGWPSLNEYFSNPAEIVSFIVIFFGIIFAILVSAVLIQIFLLYPLEVGGRKYFIQSAQYFDNRGCFRFAFSGYNYGGIVRGILLRNVYTFLWTLLLIIPGIVKSYAYSMVPYILAENPNIGASRAIELSNNMTYGHKFDMFVLQLSFVGWYIAGLFCFGIGAIFVNPYYDATHAELYLRLRQFAIEKGMCSLDELNLYDPAEMEYNI